MEIRYEYDPAHDVYTLNTSQVHIDVPADVALWVKEMSRASDALLAERRGEPWYCLIDIRGFRVDPSLADQYGMHAKQFVAKYFRAAVRFGCPSGLSTAAAIRLGAIRNRFPADIFADRATALLVIATIRRNAA